MGVTRVVLAAGEAGGVAARRPRGRSHVEHRRGAADAREFARADRGCQPTRPRVRRGRSALHAGPRALRRGVACCGDFGQWALLI